ncbi:MAG: hypothetical protein LBT75_04930 [Bacilli bacterium]|nr:hypothetical protein [Bacilli bacterium]
MQKKDIKLLIVSIVSGIEMSLMLLIWIILMIFARTNAFKQMLIDDNFQMNELGFDNNALINLIVIIFSIMVLLSVAKFVLALITYLKNKRGLKIALISLIGVNVGYFALACIAGFDVIILALLLYQIFLLALCILSYKEDKNDKLVINIQPEHVNSYQNNDQNIKDQSLNVVENDHNNKSDNVIYLGETISKEENNTEANSTTKDDGIKL